MRTKTNDAFAAYHPALNLSFFVFVILCTVFVLHPVLLAISFSSALLYALRLNGSSTLRLLCALLPLMLLAAFVNAAFNHTGVTILFYARGNPITLEALLYGLAAASMLACVMLWFSCYHTVMTSDKFVFLFGRVIPALSLVFSMAMRFIPKFTAQFKKVSNAQRTLGRDVSLGNVFLRVKNGGMILSICTTWALENAVDTADSMKARGYGLPGRTAAKQYRLETRDKVLFIAFLCLVAAVLTALGAGVLPARYFPSLYVGVTGLPGLLGCAAFGAACLLPLFLGWKEDLLWRSLRLKT